MSTTEDAPVSLFHDSPYSISKFIGEMYGNYYWNRHIAYLLRLVFRMFTDQEKFLEQEVWTPSQFGEMLFQPLSGSLLTGEFLPLDNGGNASRDFIFVEDMAKGFMCSKRTARHLQPCF